MQRIPRQHVNGLHLVDDDVVDDDDDDGDGGSGGVVVAVVAASVCSRRGMKCIVVGYCGVSVESNAL